MKKLLLTTLLCVVFLFPIPSQANQYGLFGEGNCTYFATEFVERFWPVAFDINGDWDACKWVGLIGREQDGYRIEQTDSPQPGDIFILPRSKEYPRGHVGVIIGSYIHYNFSDGKQFLNYRVIESSMYATEQGYPYLLGRCRYAYCSYGANYLKDQNAVFITCVKGGENNCPIP